MVKIVYTVLLGNYKLNEPKYLNNNWKHICFTDQNITSKNWEILYINTRRNNRKKSREIKILLHNYLYYDLCLYLDAKFTIKIDLDTFIAKNLKSDLTVMRHNKRKCLYDEGKFCIKVKNEKEHVILKQLEYYKKQGMPTCFGLYAPGIMIKKNNKTVNHFMDLWFKQIIKFSYRDIISFPYILWKHPIKLDTIPFKETYELFKADKNC